MRSSYQIITPEIAEKMLSRGDFVNRKMKKDVVARYANDMKAGRWKENGESIVIDRHGAVIDGQHRLKAVSLAGIPCGFILVEGVQRSVFDTFDIGKNRSASDTLQVIGKRNVKALASVLRMIDDYKRNGTDAFTRKASSKGDQSFDVQNALESYPDSEESTAFCHSHCHHLVMRPLSVAGTFHYLFGEIDYYERNVFFDCLLKMSFCGDGCPVKALASVHQNSKTINHMNSNRAVRCAYWIKSWNAFRLEKKIKCLTFSPEHHEFPEIL